MTTPSPSISPLRQRMMDDMRMRRLAPTTQVKHRLSPQVQHRWWPICSSHYQWMSAALRKIASMR